MYLLSSSSSGHVDESVDKFLSNSKTRSWQQLQEEVEEPSHNCSILSHEFDSKDQVLCWMNLFTCYLDASFQQFSNKPVFSSFCFLLTHTFGWETLWQIPPLVILRISKHFTWHSLLVTIISILCTCQHSSAVICEAWGDNTARHATHLRFQQVKIICRKYFLTSIKQA